METEGSSQYGGEKEYRLHRECCSFEGKREIYGYLRGP